VGSAVLDGDDGVMDGVTSAIWVTWLRFLLAQVIPITGANGRVIDVMFVWIRNNDGIIRLVTGIPAKLWTCESMTLFGYDDRFVIDPFR
jgi:hypothetical protein